MRTAHTPNGTTTICDRHAKTLQKIADAMGFHVNFTAIVANTLTHKQPECANCINEKDK
jgi:hypothetical protein